MFVVTSSPGRVFTLTPGLSVSVPNDIGRHNISWHDESEPAGVDEPLPKIVNSFLSVQLHGGIGEEERKWIHRLKQKVSWLIIEMDGEIASQEIRFEAYVDKVLELKRVEHRIGIRFVLDEEIPAAIIVPWVVKAAIMLGEPALIFLDGESLEKVVDVLRRVQDQLLAHPLSLGAAKLVPHLHTDGLLIDGVWVPCFDFHLLDCLLIETKRPFCGGVSLQTVLHPSVFGLSLEAIVSRMVVESKASASILESWKDGTVPISIKVSLFQHFYALVRAIHRGDDKGILAVYKQEFEKIWQQAEPSETLTQGVVTEILASGERYLSCSKYSWKRSMCS